MSQTSFIPVFLVALFSVASSTNVSDPIFDLNKTTQAFYTCTSNLAKEVQISSQCRQLCIEDERCVAFYTYPFSYRWKCFLFPYGERHRYSNSTGQNGVSGVKIYPGSKLEADGLYYVLLKDISPDFTSARKDCKVSPGFRLALIKTRLSYNVALTYQTYGRDGSITSIDLQQNIGNKNATLGDGTPYEDTPLAKSGMTLSYDNYPSPLRAVFTIWNGGLSDSPEIRPYRPLCQADPLMMMT